MEIASPPAARLDPARRREIAARLQREIDRVQLVDRMDAMSIYVPRAALEAGARAGELVALDARADRSTLLAAAKAGAVARLEIEGVTFIQWPKKPNRNYVRVKAGAMQALASSFEGAPVLRDHENTLDARAGTILESKLERNETADGTEYRIRMRMELVKEWAILAVLDGTLDRFSISFMRAPGAKVLCSVHNSPIFTKCCCCRGEVADDGQVVEFVYAGAEGLEVSGVSVPAVTGTGIDSIRQLRAELAAQGLDVSALPSILGADTSPSRESTMHQLIAAVIGLAATATEDEIVEGVRALKADRDAKADELALAADKLEAERKARGAAEAELAAHAAKEREAKVENAIAALKAAGKLAPGSKAEEALRRTAERDLALFEAEVADRLEHGARQTPAGQKLQTSDPASSATPADDALATNPHLAPMLRAAGITREQFEKHGMPAHEALLAQRAR